MKLSIVFASAFAGLVLGSTIGIASATEDQVTRPTKSPALDPSVSVDVPTITVIEVPEMVIVGTVPARQVASTKRHFVCGETYTNDVGGRNSDCFWR